MVAVLGALLALCAAASPAQATSYRLTGDKGTVCNVEVGASASTGVGALSGAPRVGFSSTPACTYAAKAATAGSGTAGARTAAKACKRKKTKRAKARCKAKKRTRTRSTPALVDAPALIDHAKLSLLAPLTNIPGNETLASLGIGGYTCLLKLGANCSDSGQLEPALPLVSYVSQFSVRVTPPPGEHWTSLPAGCSGTSVVSCVLSSAAVVPKLF